MAAGSLVRLMLLDFDVEGHVRCRYDFVDVFDVIDGYDKNKRRLCGSDVPPLIISQSNHVKIFFHTDVFTNRRGFHIKYATGKFSSYKSPRSFMHDDLWPFQSATAKLVVLEESSNHLTFLRTMTVT